MIAHLLIDTINVASVSGSNLKGETFGAAVAVKCKIEEGSERSIGTDAISVERTDKFITLTEIKDNDRIWFPGQSTSDTTLARRPKKITKARQISNKQSVWEVEI